MKHWAPAAEDALSGLAEFSTEMMSRISPEGRYLYVSPSAAHIFGRPVDDVVGTHILHFVFEDDKPDLFAAVQKFSQSDLETFDYTVRIWHGDGSLRWVEINSRLIGDPSLGQTRDTATVVRDVTDRKKIEDQLREMATTDGLTGLRNRRAFDQYILECWDDAARDQSELSLLLIDIDHFKNFNDSFGHQTGDDCLRAVAQTLLSLPIAKTGMVARYGGEEIAVILPHVDSASASKIAELARNAVAELSLPQSAPAMKGYNLTISVGCATAIVRPGGSSEMPFTLVLVADRALYLAKQKGRNRVEGTIIIGAPL